MHAPARQETPPARVAPRSTRRFACGVLGTLTHGLVLGVLAGPTPVEATAQTGTGGLAQRGLEWHEVDGSAGRLNVALVRPEEGAPGPHPVVLALPWGAGTADLVESFVASYWLREPAARGYYVVAPEVPGSRLAATADEILDAIFSWMDAALDYDAARVALVGASNGGRGAFFAAVTQPERFGALMVLPGRYGGPAEDLAALAGMPIYFIVGEYDERWFDATQSTRRALESHDIESWFWVAPGQGHVVRMDPRPMLDWIDSVLDVQPPSQPAPG